MSKTSPQGSLSMDNHGPADPRAEAVSESDPWHQRAVASNLRARALASPSQPDPLSWTPSGPGAALRHSPGGGGGGAGDRPP